MSLICMNDWHHKRISHHCSSCGKRKDSKTTLANASIGLLGIQMLIKHEKTEIVASLDGMIFNGVFNLSNPQRIIKMEDAHYWIVQ